jgi:hypothetical protein
MSMSVCVGCERSLLVGELRRVEVLAANLEDLLTGEIAFRPVLNERRDTGSGAGPGEVKVAMFGDIQRALGHQKYASRNQTQPNTALSTGIQVTIHSSWFQHRKLSSSHSRMASAEKYHR